MTDAPAAIRAAAGRDGSAKKPLVDESEGMGYLERLPRKLVTVYLPLGWWHQVTALDMSLSFSYSNVAVPNLYSYQNPEIRNW
jgi:hypothetical protein